MFIRKTHKNDPISNKKYFLFQLVESFRTDRGPRQKILLNLGSELDLPSKEDEKLLANRIEELVSGQHSFFETPDYIEKLAQTYAKQLIQKRAIPQPSTKTLQKEDFCHVDLNSLEHEHARSVGIEHIVVETLKKLEIDSVLRQQGLTQKSINTILGSIVGRLTAPGSERATHQWLQCQSAVDELLDTDFSNLSLDSLYLASDQLLRSKNILEDHLVLKEADLFCLNNTIVLLDFTNTFFEGAAEGVSLANYGHSKERRTDCPLVTLGLTLNTAGFPIKSKILPGNISEPATLVEAINELNFEKQEKPIVIVDAGFATMSNLKYLRENGYRYIVAGRSRTCELPFDLPMQNVSHKVDNAVYVGVVDDVATGEKLLYCHSEKREKKERSMCSLLQERFERDLKIAHQALHTRGGTKEYKKVLERIGRLKEKHRRISSRYDITVHTDVDEKYATEILWKVKSEELENRFQGGYLLRSYGLDWAPQELWSTYMMLTKVEEGFRCLKGELGLRPIFHQIDRRVKGHLFISVIAYHVMQTVLHQLDAAGISIRWRILQQMMASQVRVTTTMRTQDGRQVHIRKSTNPDSQQKSIYQALHIASRPGQAVKTII